MNNQVKYVMRPSWTGDSKNLLLTPVQDPAPPKSDTPIDDYLKKIDERINQSQKELENDVKALKDEIKQQVSDNANYVLEVLTTREDNKNTDRFRTSLYWTAFICIIYLNIVAPVFNSGFDLGKKIIGFLPISTTSLTSPGTLPGASTNKDFSPVPIPSKLDPSKVVSAMQRKGYRVRTGPGELNVVYVFNPNFAETIDTWSDRRLLITYKNGQPTIVHDSPATIKGGRPSWLNPPNPKGYPVTVPGQYLNSWAVGYHKGKRALAQVGPIPVMRTKDQGRTWRRDYGLFGINQHRGAGAKVGKWSEGCHVSQSGHEQFMATIYTDPAYRQNRSFRFPTTIISMNDVATVTPQKVQEKTNAREI